MGWPPVAECAAFCELETDRQTMHGCVVVVRVV